MENEKVSIVVPVYNVEKYLDDCIGSIVTQTHTNIEIIIVDDGSTDNSGAICDRWAARDERITVIHKENAGISDARNVGFAQITSDYVCFVDSDDMIDAVYVDMLLKKLKEDDADIILCRYYYNDGDDIIFPSADSNYRYVCDKQEFVKKVYNNLYLGMATSRLAKREVYCNVVFPEGHRHEDVAVIRRIAYNCNKISSIDKALYFYRQRKGSIMNRTDDDLLKDRFSWIVDDVAFYKADGNKELMVCAEKLFCHNVLKYIKQCNKSMQEDLKKIYKEYRRDICLSRYTPLKGKIKYCLIRL